MKGFDNMNKDSMVIRVNRPIGEEYIVEFNRGDVIKIIPNKKDTISFQVQASLLIVVDKGYFNEK